MTKMKKKKIKKNYIILMKITVKMIKKVVYLNKIFYNNI